jgi:tyrosinase
MSRIDAIGRRQFIGAITGAIGGLSVADSLRARNRVFAEAIPQAGPIRKNVASLPAGDTTLASYAQAITAMRQRSQADPKDPLGWTFQANMHWTPQGEMILDPAWNGCQHGTRWFFPWHRGYLYFFERIIRKLSGNADFSLPYWKWDDPMTMALPAPFRTDPNSPLFDGTRGINDGTPVGDEVLSDLAQANEQDYYDPTADGRQGFTLLIDGGPHGDVHVDTGGLMGSVPTAARDAVFFLHHANVDRLLNRWRDNQQHAIPTDDQWLKNQWNQGQSVPFKYYDENGALVQWLTSDVLQMTAGASRYDDDPAPLLAAREARPQQPAQRISVPSTLASASKESFPLTNQPTAVPLALGANNAARVSRMMQPAARQAAAPPRVFVVIQGITGNSADVPVHYGVYLKTKGQNAAEEGQYIGTINFFGKAEHGAGASGHEHTDRFTFDEKFEVTKALAKLGGADAAQVQDLVVTLSPVVNGKPRDKKALETARVTGLSFERIVVQTIE